MINNIETIKFSPKTRPEFIDTLRERVNSYFRVNRISKYGNKNMVLKTVFMFSLFIIPYSMMITGVFSGSILFLLLWIIMGLGMAGIGLSVMHDANHGSYSGNRRVNKLLGYTLNMLGGNSYLWKIQHNYLHHAYTNIENADDDIHVPHFLRFSPHSEKHAIQRFQHIYVWFFYAISTLLWVTSKNILQFFRYRKKNLIKKNKEFSMEFAKEIIWKALYYFVFIALPVILLPVPVWLIVVSFMIMHSIMGLSLSAIFQPAHIMPSSEYPLPDNKGNMENNWAIHQVLTTSDYAPKSRIFSWLIGGLNFQIEHHLFPNICHVHYYTVSKFVKQTSAEFGLPYHVQPTFFHAIRNHIKMLKRLGNHELNNEIPLVNTDNYLIPKQETVHSLMN